MSTLTNSLNNFRPRSTAVSTRRHVVSMNRSARNKTVTKKNNVRTNTVRIKNTVRTNTVIRNIDDLPSIGIISINAESEKFPSEIEESFKEKFKGFTDLDIIIIGLQEDSPKSHSDTFTKKLFSSSHVLIDSKYMVGIQKGFAGIRILFFLKKDIKNINVKTFSVCNHESCKGHTYCCSKGLVAIKFNNFTIINSHLAMGLKGLSFSDGVKKRATMLQTLFVDLNKKFQAKSRLFNIDTDHMIWFGDLNFRVSPPDNDYQTIIGIINSNMKYGTIKKDLTETEFIAFVETMKIQTELQDSFNVNNYIKNDELLENVLDGKHRSIPSLLPFDLHEAPINFNPTCKLVKGSENKYDVLKNGKLRLPSWCDRILFNSNMKENYNVTEYNSFKFPIKSDHNGVYAIFKPKHSSA